MKTPRSSRRTASRAGLQTGIVIAAAILAGLAAPGVTGAIVANQRDLILRGGPIYTLDDQHPWAEALVVHEGRIVYVGSAIGAQAFVRPGSRVVDLHGRMALPAFHDAHSHPLSGGLALSRCLLDDLDSVAKIHARIRACAGNLPKQAWLLGSGWKAELFGAAGPSRADLDELVPDRPAYLSTAGGYVAWVNTAALATAGVEDIKATALEGVRLDENRKPSGVLGGSANDLVRGKIPPPSPAQYREALRRAMAVANQFGITSILDASVNAAMLDAYHAAALAGELTVRVIAAQRIDRGRGADQIPELLARARQVRGSLLRADAAKIFLDGEIDLHTAALLQPYADMPDGSVGPPLDARALATLVRRLDAEGFMIHFHAMGDRAVRIALDSVATAIKANGPRDRRHQIAHIGVADPADIPRFAALRVAANFQPLWFQVGDPASAGIQKALGSDRAQRMYPIASVSAAGGRIVGSSDWASTSMNPLDGIQVAITRQPLDGNGAAQQPEQRVALASILRAYTRDAAWASGSARGDGTIEVGNDADLVVLDRNLFGIPAAELHRAKVLLTVLSGVPVYCADPLCGD